jgi:hypothetical protein
LSFSMAPFSPPTLNSWTWRCSSRAIPTMISAFLNRIVSSDQVAEWDQWRFDGVSQSRPQRVETASEIQKGAFARPVSGCQSPTYWLESQYFFTGTLTESQIPLDQETFQDAVRISSNTFTELFRWLCS